MWGAANILDYMGFPDEYVMMTLFVGMAMWISGVYGYHSHQTKECVQLNAFPQSKWHFDPSTTMAVDLFIPKKGAKYKGNVYAYDLDGKKRAEPDIHNPGKHVYEVGPFPCSLAYDHPDLGLITFDTAYWILPDVWNRTFFFQTGGEVWWNGIPVNHPNTESIALYVVGWENLKGEMVPVCQVANSNWHYKHRTEAVRAGALNLTAKDIETTKNMVLKTKVIELEIALKDTEHHLDAVLGETDNVEKIIRMRIEDYKKRYGSIMRVGEKWQTRLINMKTFAIGLVVVVVAVLLWWLLAG